VKDAALLIVDVQNGFISERRELPVKGGAEVVPLINDLMPRFRIRAAGQDWHPPGHGSFASSHEGVKPFDEGTLHGRPQVFWPDHCVQGTRGAEFHPDLDQRPIQAVFRKGTDPRVDSYSMFADNNRDSVTGLDGYLSKHRVGAIYVAGLALDYCVRFTALDARRLLPGLPVTVLVDACRSVDPRTEREALEEMREAGIRLAGISDLDS